MAGTDRLPLFSIFLFTISPYVALRTVTRRSLPGHGHCFVLLARGNFGQIQTFSAIENGDSKAAYLERHKPLSDNERESLLADAFEPVAYVPTPD